MAAAAITAAGWTAAGRWQHQSSKSQMENSTRLQRIEDKLGALGDKLAEHTADPSLHRRRRGFLVPALLVTLWRLTKGT